MSAAENAATKDDLRSVLLKHGVDLNGTIGTSLTWESPIRIFRSAHVNDAEIGAYSYISPRSEIRHTTIGRYCSIGDSVDMRGSAHPKEWLSSHPFPYTNLFSSSRPYCPPLTFEGYAKRTRIGHDVWVGSRAMILPGVTVGTGAVIGAGAIVVKDVPAYAVVVGNPAQVVKFRFEPSLIDRLLKSEWWMYDLPRFLEECPGAPLDNPEKMLDLLDRSGGEIPRIDPSRKSYSRRNNKFVIRRAAAAAI